MKAMKMNETWPHTLVEESIRQSQSEPIYKVGKQQQKDPDLNLPTWQLWYDHKDHPGLTVSTQQVKPL